MAHKVFSANRLMLVKLVVVTGLMFGFGYALVPMYRTICAQLNLNVLSLSSNVRETWSGKDEAVNTQVDLSRTVSVEFDANAHGPWEFHPAKNALDIHPGEMVTVDYEFRNTQNRTMTAQAIPSYAPGQASPYFHKLECFCFTQWTLAPGESKHWPVVFVVDPKLPRDVTTITLSYTFFEVGGRTPPAPGGPDA